MKTKYLHSPSIVAEELGISLSHFHRLVKQERLEEPEYILRAAMSEWNAYTPDQMKRMKKTFKRRAIGRPRKDLT